MVSKGRKLLALLLMVALVVTYTFGANFSVFAEEGQGEPKASPSASENVTPDKPKEKATEESSTTEQPATAESSETADESDAAAKSDSESNAEEATEGEDALEGEIIGEDAPPAKATTTHRQRTLEYDASFTCVPVYTIRPGSSEVEHWELSGADENCYLWDEDTLTITNKNRTENLVTVKVTHTINIPGNHGFSNVETWNFRLRTANRVTVNYFSEGSRVHQDVSYESDYKSYTIWGVPEREGFAFLGWARSIPRPGSTHVDFRPGQTVDLSDRDVLGNSSWNSGHATLNLYAVWREVPVNLGPVTGKSDTIPYDGEEHVLYGIAEDPDVESGWVVIGSNGSSQYSTRYYIKAEEVFAKGTEVGDYTTVPSYVMAYSKANTPGSQYHEVGFVKVNPGTLTILNTDDTLGPVHGKSDTVQYDGREHTLYGIEEVPDVTSGYAIIKSTGPMGDSYAVLAEDIFATGVDAGEYNTTVKYAQIYHKPNNMGGNWQASGKYVKVIPGTLTIVNVDNTLGPVTGKSDEIPYDGEEHTIYGIEEVPEVTSGYAIIKSTGPMGDSYAVLAEDIFATGTEVGEYNTTVKYAQIYHKPNNMGGTWEASGKYVEVKPGTLTILGKMTLSTYGYSGQYDGHYKTPSATCSEADATISWKYRLDGGEWSDWTTEKPFIRNAGELEFQVKAEKEGFETVTTGTRYVISKAPLKVIVKDQEYTYDRQPHGIAEGTVEGDAASALLTLNRLQAYDSVSAVCFNDGLKTDAGTYEDILSVNEEKELVLAYKSSAQYESGETIEFNASRNYDVEYVPGTLTINKRPINVAFVGTTKTVDYNGYVQSNDEYTFEISDRAYHSAWIGFNKEPLVEKRVAGEHALGLTPKDLYNNTEDYPEAANFEVTFTVKQDLKLIINKAKLTIIVSDQEYTYNGQPHGIAAPGDYYGITEVEKVAKAEGLKGPDKLLQLSIIPYEETETGTYEDTLKVNEKKPITIGNDQKESVHRNYDVTFVDGTLTINAAPTPGPTPGPTPDPGGGGGGGAGGDGGGAPAAAAVAPAAPAAVDGVEVVDNATPTTIGDNAAPKSAPENSWALLDLIAAILTLLGAGLAVFRKNSATSVVKGVGLAAAAASIILFFVTQDLSAPMVLADVWTIVMAALFCVQCITTAITLKTPQVDD